MAVTSTLLISLTVMVYGTHFSEAGSCWESYNSVQQRCYGLIATQYTKEQCCDFDHGSFYRVKNLTDKQLFFHFTDGVAHCVPCVQQTKIDICQGVVCPAGKICKIKSRNRTKCVCKRKCKDHRGNGPVCGSDGRTYKNECYLKKKACRERRTNDLLVAYDGRCRDNCAGVVCRDTTNGSKQSCVVDQRNRAHCVSCDNLCGRQSKHSGGKVCGVNGVTYDSRCELRKATCRLGKTIGLAYYGRCGHKNCSTVTCRPQQKCIPDKAGKPLCITCHCQSKLSKFGADDLLCGTDGRTYKRKCTMDKQSCKIGRLVEVKNYGTCKSTLVNLIKQAKKHPSSDSPSHSVTKAEDSIAGLLRALKAQGYHFRFKSHSNTPMKFDIKLVMKKMIERFQRSGARKKKTKIPLKSST